MAGTVSTVHLTADGSEVTKTFRQIEISAETASKKIQNNIEKAAQGGNNFNAVLDRMEKSLKGIATIGATGGALYAIGNYMLASSRAAAEEEVSLKKLDAVLKATSYSAGLGSERIKGFADEMQRLTFFDDGAIRDASSVLLTFRNISGSTFEAALASAMDMNTVLGGDLQSSALQLGKALNDPIQGINALRRAGVSFTAEQKNQIEGLVRSNNLFEAQQIILQELNQEFGGSAQAVLDSHNGRLNTMADSWETLQEAIGGYLNDSRTTSGVIVGITSAIDRQTDAFERHTGAIYGVLTAVDALSEGLFMSARGWGMIFENAGKAANSPFFRAMMQASGMPVDILSPREQPAGEKAPFSFGGGSPGGRGATRDFGSPVSGGGGKGTGVKLGGGPFDTLGFAAMGFSARAGMMGNPNEIYQGNINRMAGMFGSEGGALSERDMQVQRDDAAEAVKIWQDVEAQRIRNTTEGFEQRKALSDLFYEQDRRLMVERYGEGSETVRALADQHVQEMISIDQEMNQAMRDNARYTSQYWAETFYQMGESAHWSLQRILDDLAQIARHKALTSLFEVGIGLLTGGGGGGLVGMAIKGISSIFRADGGPVNAGNPYVVGERRPELFVPKTSGFIYPTVPAASKVPQMAGNTVNHVNFSMTFSPAEKREMLEMSDTQLALKLIRIARDDRRVVKALTGKS
jgi:hypothetical protein